MPGIQKHTLPRPKGLVEGDVVLDIGAGIRPMRWYQPKHHVCVEPYAPYCEVLRQAGLETYRLTAEQALQPWVFQGVDAVYLLDVIEHMDKAEAWRVLALAQDLVRVQLVIYTPWGFKEQTTDVWGMGGDSWQTHRSGWTRADFPVDEGWTVELFWPSDRKGREPEGFYATWNATTIPS